MHPAATVYAVDDDAACLAVTARVLQSSGFEVEAFESSIDFLVKCRKGTVLGCAVVDLHMPGLNGLELQQRLADVDNSPPIVFLAGQGDIASSVRAMRAGAEDFLEKPAPREELVDAVQRALARDARQRAERAGQDALRARFSRLTGREREVLSHVLRGRLNKQIAQDLQLHERTVKLHRASIRAKVGVGSVAALAQLAQAAGVALTAGGSTVVSRCEK